MALKAFVTKMQRWKAICDRKLRKDRSAYLRLRGIPLLAPFLEVFVLEKAARSLVRGVKTSAESRLGVANPHQALNSFVGIVSVDDSFKIVCVMGQESDGSLGYNVDHGVEA